MDRDTYKPQVPESLVADEIIHNLESTDLTASLQNELSSKVRSDLGVTDPQENNVCKCELFWTNIRPESPDHQEDVQQITSTPAVKQEIIDIFPKNEIAEDVKEEINDNPIKGEIQEYINLANATKSPRLSTVRTDTKPVVIKNEMADERAQKDFEGPKNSGKLGINEVICKVKIENSLIEPTVRDKSDSDVTGPYEENVCKCEHQEDIKQDTSISAVKYEMMDIVMKKEETDVVFKGEIYEDQIIKEEIKDCKEYIKMEDGMNCPSVDTLKETKSESQPDVMENEVSEEDGLQQERNNGDLDDEVSRFHKRDNVPRLRFSKRVRKTRILPGAVTVTSLNEGSDSGESQFLSSVEENDHEEDGNECSKSKHQPHRNKRQKKIRSMDNIPQKGDSWHGNKKKSCKTLCRDSLWKSHSADRPHQCKVCTKYFKTPITLRNHLRLHSDQLKYSCADCEKSFSRLSNLKSHQLLHTGEKLFTCEICDKTFARHAVLHRHMVIHQEVKPFSCMDCGKSFSWLGNLKTHQLLHTGKKLFACEICDKSFAQSSGLHHHKITHKEVKPFACMDCGKSFSLLCNLRTHQLLHTGKKLFTCEICDKTFAQPDGLCQHMKTHQAVKSFTCTVCKKSFSQLLNLKTHQLLHTGKRSYACEMCNKSFLQLADLRQHMVTHQAVKPFSCTDCAQSFSQLSHLKTHQLVHTGKKSFACEICDKTFAQHAGLYQHMITHKEMKPFLCADCGKSFSQLRNLRTHQFLHMDKKFFACEICNKSFTQPGGLRSHMNTHKKVKPFSCTDCGKSFAHSSNLKEHKFLHTGKKLFTCEICDKSFAQRSVLHRHIRRLH